MAYFAVGLLLALLLWGVARLMLRLWRALRRLGRPSPASRRDRRLTRSRALARSEQARAQALSEEVARLRQELRMARRPSPDSRFQRAKREFARRFHPDRLPRRGPERTLRVMIFRDYWAVLRRIEREE
ncbi:hypothetical protein ACVFYP_05750 [Roseomonas sp. F4]